MSLTAPHSSGFSRSFQKLIFVTTYSAAAACSCHISGIWGLESSGTRSQLCQSEVMEHQHEAWSQHHQYHVMCYHESVESAGFIKDGVEELND